MVGRTMIHWAFRLPQRMREAVRVAASLDGRTMAGWVRQAISEKLARG